MAGTGACVGAGAGVDPGDVGPPTPKGVNEIVEPPPERKSWTQLPVCGMLGVVPLNTGVERNGLLVCTPAGSPLFTVWTADGSVGMVDVDVLKGTLAGAYIPDDGDG